MSIGEQPSEAADEPLQSRRAQHIKVKNRRKTYLDKNPDYFNPSLELAGTPGIRGMAHDSANKFELQILFCTTG